MAQLARQVGVSRQTIYAMEAGDYVPNTTVALQLAKALETGVEEIFTLEDDAPAPAALAPLEWLGAGAQPGEPLQLCRVGNRTLGIPAPPGALAMTLADGVAAGPAAVRIFDDQTHYDKRLLIAGCDPAISLLAQYLVRAEGIEMVLAPCSSRRALEWLQEGKTHLAGSHWKDDRTGEYNMPLVRKLFPRGGVQVVTFALWEEGLVVARGNPKSIRGAEDLARKDVSIVNREQGAGSRQLLDKKLAAAGVDTSRVRGYGRTAEGHLAAALAVNSGSADCCVATRAAARAFGLDFIPLATERYDLVFRKSHAELPALQSLLDALNRSALRRKLEAMAGYDTSHTGEMLPG